MRFVAALEKPAVASIALEWLFASWFLRPVPACSIAAVSVLGVVGDTDGAVETCRGPGDPVAVVLNGFVLPQIPVEMTG